MLAAEDHERLIELAVAGDRVSTGRLLLSHASELSRFIAARLPADVAAVASVEDVLQDTFVAAFRDIGKFESRASGTFAGWLRTIAERQVLCTLDRLRAAKRGGGRRQTRPAGQHTSSMIELFEQLSDSSDRPSSKAANREAVFAVQVGLASLPESQQEAVRLRHLDGKSIDETAAAMRRPPGAVRGLLQRARKSLRDALGRSSRWFHTK